MARLKKKRLQPASEAKLSDALNEVRLLAEWARGMGYPEVAERLWWLHAAVTVVAPTKKD